MNITDFLNLAEKRFNLLNNGRNYRICNFGNFNIGIGFDGHKLYIVLTTRNFGVHTKNLGLLKPLGYYDAGKVKDHDRIWKDTTVYLNPNNEIEIDRVVNKTDENGNVSTNTVRVRANEADIQNILDFIDREFRGVAGVLGIPLWF